MAIKERLLKQLQIVRDGLNAMPPFLSRDLNATRNALVQARDLCFQGLSENRFAEYKDTYDGLLLAIDQLTANVSDQGEIVSLCSELLQHTITQTLKETAFKKEIFFLPYKASMWDSLESVWKAADEDVEHCIAYVMPIPYADLTPEHTVAEWHCERNLFPKDVPTVNWEDFDLQEIHPDVIFIHNPYDEYNRVTSVESRYYSSVLKNQTDKLVYIPYFVLDEIVPGNEATEEHISGFVFTPAVLNADEVIVQSEDMRQVYINVLLRNTDQKDRAYWEKRILGLGSPKIDKVLTSKKEDFELPEAWTKIVKGKKVILYNTSLSAMLQNTDKVCDKLRHVFDELRHCDDVALWWRPHPLMKATIHSMRPEIEKEYCEIEKTYIGEGWGIYDDTSDLHRAIAWSDVYFGDASSVVQLYRGTGKPIMLYEMSPLPDFYHIRLRFMAVYMDEEYIYFVPSADRGTFWGRMRIDDGSTDIKILKDTAGHGLMTKIMGAVPTQEKLLIYPLYGRKLDELILYHPQDEGYEIIKTAKVFGVSCCPPPRSFRSLCAYHNKIFAVTWSWPRVITVDLDSKIVNYIDMQEAVKKTGLSFDGSTGLHLSCMLRGHFYVLYYDHDVIFDIDAEQEKLDVIRRLKGNLKIRLLETDGEYLWLGAADGRVVRYDVRIGNSHIYEQRMPLYKGEQYFCNGYMLYYKGALHFFSTYISLNPKCLYTRFDIQRGKFADVKVIENVGWLNNVVWADNGTLLISSKFKNMDKVFLLDLSDMEMKEWTIKLLPEQERALKQQILHDYRDMGIEFIQEDVDDITVKDIANYCMTSKVIGNRENVGKSIYEHIIGKTQRRDGESE